MSRFSIPFASGTVLMPILLLVAFFLLLPTDQGLAQEKTKIEKLDDLPRHNYEIDGTVTELIDSDAAFSALTSQVKSNLLSILDNYEIEDRTTLQRIYGNLQTIAFLEGDRASVFSYLEKRKAIEDKEAEKLLTGHLVTSILEAEDETGQAIGEPAFRSRFREILASKIAALPFEVVQEQIEGRKGMAEMVSETMLKAHISIQMEPAVEKSGFLSSEQAEAVIGTVAAMKLLLPVKEEVISVYADAINANRVEKEDIWPARGVSFTGDEGHAEVVVAVWDTGVDTDLYSNQLHVNRAEKADGQDTDGNGFIDDLYGIAYDKDQDKTPELLFPLGDQQARRPELEEMFQGFFDLQAALDTEDAAKVKKTMAEMQPDEVQPWMENMILYTMHSHGTHVAGIALDGNPYARLTVARLGTDYKMIPDPPTMEQAEKLAHAFQETVGYFKSRKARVVNMSWVMGVRGFESDLESNGIGESSEERGRMAREMFAVAKEGLRRAFESAPEILFVGGAGNFDDDVDFEEYLPPAFDLPNLLIAGAVDQSGQETGFTSMGKSVGVYSNGFEVDSYVPGGRRMKLSGTSMASPNVVNLAAKLLAIDPELTPEQVIGLIKNGAENAGGEDFPMLVIHPQRSVELLATRGSGTERGSSQE